MPTIISVIAFCLFLFFYFTSKDNTKNMDVNTDVKSFKLKENKKRKIVLL